MTDATRLEEIRARHAKVSDSGYLPCQTVIYAGTLANEAHADRGELLSHIDRLTEERDGLKAERDKLAQSYRCYSCKQVFDEDHGHGQASEHFGDWLKGDRPKCEDCLRGTATWGGGPHDPFYRVRKEEYEKLLQDRAELTRLRAQIEAEDDDNALWS